MEPRASTHHADGFDSPACWVLAETPVGLEPRQVREGSVCPRCRQGRLARFCGPDDHEFYVVCNTSGCALRWEVLINPRLHL